MYTYTHLYMLSIFRSLNIYICTLMLFSEYVFRMHFHKIHQLRIDFIALNADERLIFMARFMLHFEPSGLVVPMVYTDTSQVSASLLQSVAVCCSLLQSVAGFCSLLQDVAVCCRMLQLVAACSSLLQDVAACCSV